ncbi:hypothetical protein [uncultured Clostridium sp.]|uniref:phosphoribosyltransferase-like protein n=1 Tax=uncultured Clostridium sp. TaxID=59620 RepID=UPI00260146A0|nr:hypothetical protein [uncultured Clostridium sp.]
MKKIFDSIIYKVYGLEKFEEKLSIYDGYKKGSIIEWKNNYGMTWRLSKKILKNIIMFDTNQIREMLRKIVEENKDIFERENLYITSFGNKGKSGDLILYQFIHAMPQFGKKVKNTWELNGLPEESTIVFLDDLIGTGSQSIEYINKKLNLIISPSYSCYLVCLCTTEAGLERVKKETNFNVLNAILLNKEKYEHLSRECTVFNEKEKEVISQINNMLNKNTNSDYNKGLLLAFSHCVPNNSMPLIWKDGFPYKDLSGEKRKWKAILPRQF